MIKCSCSAPDVEYTVAKDLASGVILLSARCENCGKSATSFGTTVEQALKRVTKKWNKEAKSWSLNLRSVTM